MEKETLEEVCKRYYENNIDQSNIPKEHYEWEIQDLMIGFAIEWQQKRMYSEEDLREAFKQSRQALIFEKDMPPVYENFEEWFKQFKNK